MKKIFTLKAGLLSLLLVGFGIIGSSSGLMAQGDVYALPTEIFVAPSVAIQRLDAGLAPLKHTLTQNPEGSSAYKTASTKINAYYYAKDAIENGKSVAEGIVAGLYGATAAPVVPPSNPTFAATSQQNSTLSSGNGWLLQIRQELINLLKI